MSTFRSGQSHHMYPQKEDQTWGEFLPFTFICIYLCVPVACVCLFIVVYACTRWIHMYACAHACRRCQVSPSVALQLTLSVCLRYCLPLCLDLTYGAGGLARELQGCASLLSVRITDVRRRAWFLLSGWWSELGPSCLCGEHVWLNMSPASLCLFPFSCHS